MPNIVYIPTFPLSEKVPPNKHDSIKRPLSDKIQDILSDFDNPNLEAKRAFFIQEVFKSTGLDKEEIFNLSLSIHEHYNKIIQLYFSIGIHNEISLQQVLVDEWSNAVNDHSSTILLGKKSFYEVYQSIHGDVSLTRIQIPDQGELFPKKWENINDYPVESIRAHQEIMALVGSLLLGYQLSDGDIGELENMVKSFEGMQSLHCNAADSGTKNDSLYFIQNYFDIVDQNSRNLGISIYAGHQESYSVSFDKEKRR